ncbi:hypothetical protein [Vibrio harveyi]|uniref:hypothetical protein n=1 Tax=Vibrio harveyi TaxID=669 RepID=UPI00217CF17E|nr:hypothetical protein [Vibrio harveyi]
MKLYVVDGEIINLDRVLTVFVRLGACVVNFGNEATQAYRFEDPKDAEVMKQEILEVMRSPDKNEITESALRPMQ